MHPYTATVHEKRSSMTILKRHAAETSLGRENVSSHTKISLRLNTLYQTHAGQTSEFLLEKGFVDHIVPRSKMKTKLSSLIHFLS